MKQEQSSKTAWGVALVRAIEAAKPADQRICICAAYTGWRAPF